ncbi:hypothetical protein J6590_022506 [Homalodisca vitripennis]|nr:hypothetical protein J6590_022506 [Homalodisca vitripennis]
MSPTGHITTYNTGYRTPSMFTRYLTFGDVLHLTSRLTRTPSMFTCYLTCGDAPVHITGRLTRKPSMFTNFLTCGDAPVHITIGLQEYLLFHELPDMWRRPQMDCDRFNHFAYVTEVSVAVIPRRYAHGIKYL